MNEYTQIFCFNEKENPIDIFVDAFAIGKISGGCTPETIQMYKQQLGVWFRWCSTQRLLKIGDLSAQAIRAFLLEYEQEHSHGGSHAIFRSVRAYLNWIWNEYEFEWPNPVKKVKWSRGVTEPIHGVDPDDVSKLFEAAKAGQQPERDCALLAILLDTGIRKKSLYEIRKCDVNVLTGAIYIRHAKNKRPYTVYLGKRAARYVRKLMKTLTYLQDNDIIWQSREGGVMRMDNIVNILRTLSTRAGVPFYSAHDYRRYFALSSYRAGADVFAVAEMLGHQDIAVTKRYLAVDDSDIRNMHMKYSPLDHPKI